MNTQKNVYWKVKGKGILFDSDWSETKCINVPGCVDIKLPGEIQIPTPTNLKQYIKSPLLEKEEIQVGSKIGKFQSGSGVIFETEIDNPESKELKIITELYEKSSGNTRTFSSNFSNVTGKRFFTIPLDAGDYTWKLRLEDNEGNTSEWVEFGDNGTDTDFSFFEGFEPYPYGFSFVNASPDYSLLTGGISGKDSFWKGDNRKKDDGTKWEIMDMVFPLETFNGDEREYIAAFETIGLNNKRPSIFNGNCFGLSLSSLTQYHKPEILRNNFLSFSNNIGNGYIFDKINIENDINNGYKWVGLDDNTKSILALQLYQKEANYSEKEKLSLDNQKPNEILEILKSNPGKHIISFYGKTGCNFLGMGCTDVAHAVVPYKIEGNKIYIWDNNVPYPFFENNSGLKFYGYRQYIEIDIINNSFKVPFYDWNKFEKIGIVSIDDAFTNNTSVIGFNDIDTLYTLNGNSDLLITDTQGNKTGYKDGEIYEEIPGTRIISELNGTIEDNTWKQIYLPQKLENLTIEINGKTEENYDLMIAGGDYYTKLEGINTSLGQTDTFNISRENIKIDFDDSKSIDNTYNILVDDFQNNGTGSIYLHQLEIINQNQNFDIDWNKVTNNENDSIKYSVDTNNDGNYNQESYFNSMPKIENEVGSISGYINSSPSNAGYKVCIDKNNNGKCEENIEQFMVTDNTGYYKFDNLEKGDYNIIQVPRNNWEIIKPLDKKYTVKLNNGQNIVNLNFENQKGKGNNDKGNNDKGNNKK